MFKKLDDSLVQLGEAVVYFAIIAVVFLSGIALFFAIPVLLVADLMRGDYISALQFAGFEIVAFYLARGGMKVLKQIKLSGSSES